MIVRWIQRQRFSIAELKSESGQALIEAYFASSLLILLLLGAVELGRVAYAATEVSNAARAAAQYAAMNGGAFNTVGLDTSGMLVAAQNDAGDLGTLVQFVSTPSYTCACSGAGTATCGSPPSGCAGSHLIVTVTVKTKAAFNPLVFIPGVSKTAITLYGSAQQEVLQ